MAAAVVEFCWSNFHTNPKLSHIKDTIMTAGPQEVHIDIEIRIYCQTFLYSPRVSKYNVTLFLPIDIWSSCQELKLNKS